MDDKKNLTHEETIASAVAIVEQEGFKINNETKHMMKELLEDKITLEEAKNLIINS